MSPDYLIPALRRAAVLLPTVSWSAPARLLVMTIAGQESDWSSRTQIGGPARSYWQLEIEAVEQIVATEREAISSVCSALDVPGDAETIYTAIAWCDTLAAVCARLLLLPDPQPLPAIGDCHGAWKYYYRVWKPGKPGPHRWVERYATAMAVTPHDPPLAGDERAPVARVQGTDRA